MCRALYVVTRVYISQYEYWITWRGRREKLRRNLHSATNYEQWRLAAKKLDTYLGADVWKADDEFAYYDYVTIKQAVGDLRRLRQRAEEEERARSPMSNRGWPSDLDGGDSGSVSSIGNRAVDDLRELVKSCVKSNFAGIESFRMYSQTYYGTKHRVQEYIDERTFGLSVLYSGC